jgi:hypothetical protein
LTFCTPTLLPPTLGLTKSGRGSSSQLSADAPDGEPAPAPAGEPSGGG